MAYPRLISTMVERRRPLAPAQPEGGQGDQHRPTHGGVHEQRAGRLHLVLDPSGQLLRLGPDVVGGDAALSAAAAHVRPGPGIGGLTGASPS